MASEKWTSRQWWMLALLTATGTFVAAMPASCMPALFDEISADLGLDVVQVGIIWGMTSAAGILVSIIAGIISDRVNVRTIMTVLCLTAGITGALRGFAGTFFTLSFFVFLNGIFRLMLPVSTTRVFGIWFRGPRLGLAMGFGAMGMGLGLMLGPMLSATVLSPLLGGWQNVLFLYGAIGMLIGVIWWFAGKHPPVEDSLEHHGPRISIGQTLGELVKVRDIWMVGLIMLFRVGCIMGLTGYMPLYLREMGWSPAAADGTLSAFYAVSTVFVVPLAFLSDRLRSRKAILVPALIITTLAVGLMPLADGAGVWTLMVLTGMFMDGFMSLSITMLLEARSIKPVYSGIAIGMTMSIFQIGAVSSPPIGNSLAEMQAGLPFYFWAGLSAVSLVLMLMYRKHGRTSIAQPV